MDQMSIDRRNLVKGAAGAGIAAALAGAVAGTASQALAETASPYTDGTYTGTAAGMGGDINVTLTIANGQITVDEIGPNNETKGIGGYEAIIDGTYKRAVEGAQGSGFDVVAGATRTTEAIQAAVRDALAQASA